MEIIQKVTETVRISDLALSEFSGEIATRSFKAYPYDIVPEEALKMPGKLDHIFVKGLKIAENTTPLSLGCKKCKRRRFLSFRSLPNNSHFCCNIDFSKPLAVVDIFHNSKVCYNESTNKWNNLLNYK